MAVEERSLQFALEGTDLAADGGLAQAQIISGPREAARFSDRIENPDFIPVHGIPLMPSASCGKVDPGFRSNDAPAKRRSIGIDPKSGVHFWVRGSSMLLTQGNSYLL
jgi:hypothetical protein